jgi:V/A-type H+-transporting ATPase subunit C
MARHAREVYEERHSLFDLEAVLDSRYYRGLIDRYKSLNGNDRDSLRRLMGTFTDQINLVWLLRYRFVFGLASPHAYLLLIPPGYSLKRSHLLSLVQMETMENVFQSLPPPLDADVGNATSIIEVEKAMTKRTHRIAERVLRHTGFNLARALAYLILRERQILKVHVLLKGRVMKLDEESIRIAARLPDDFLQQAVAG